MNRRLARKLTIFVVVSLLATLSLVAQASAAQFDPVINSTSFKLHK